MILRLAFKNSESLVAIVQHESAEEDLHGRRQMNPHYGKEKSSKDCQTDHKQSSGGKVVSVRGSNPQETSWTEIEATLQDANHQLATKTAWTIYSLQKSP